MIAVTFYHVEHTETILCSQNPNETGFLETRGGFSALMIQAFRVFGCICTPHAFAFPCTPVYRAEKAFACQLCKQEA